MRHDDALGTVVERRDQLAELHREHVYEPGAAREALLDSLRIGRGDRVVAHRRDATPITAAEMVRLLVVDDDDASAFLRALTDTAVRIVAVEAEGSAR